MIDIAAAIIKDEGRILIAKKKAGLPLAGYWEFLCSKVADGTTPIESLKRELKEEMKIEITVEEYVGESIYDYGNEQVSIKGYICNLDDGEIELKDHDRYRWIKIEDVINYSLVPAEVELVNTLLEMQAV